MDRLLTQEEIDGVFRQLRRKDQAEEEMVKAAPYDFRRPDRIAKDQLRAIHLLHDNFARNLASSLSAYLRAYVIVNLVSVEQLSFAEFCRFLPTPTYLVSLKMRPYDGNAALELNPSLLFPILEMLLGGDGKASSNISRKVTEIEQVLLDGLYRLLLENLKQAWSAVTAIDFTIDARETEPQLLQILAPNEAVVAVTVEIRIGDSVGMMNIGIPSIIVKMLRHKFDQQWSVRRTDATQDHMAMTLNVLRDSKILVDARLRGPKLMVEDLMSLEPGDVIRLDYPIERPVDFLVNGSPKYRGRVAGAGRKRAFIADQPVTKERC